MLALGIICLLPWTCVYELTEAEMSGLCFMCY